MRKHRLLRWSVLCAATLLVQAASAKAPPGAGDGKPGNPPGKAGEPPGKPGEPPAKGKADAEHGKPDGAKGAPGDGDAAHGKDHDKGDKDKGDDHGKAEGHGRGALRELLAELKAGKLKKADVQARLAKLREDRGEREKDHREELKQRWGAALAMPAVREELEHHARRMAKLNRAMVLADTEVTKDKDKLKERISKLVDQENTRHERAMERFKTMPAAPGAAASAAATPPAAPSAAASAAATPPAAAASAKAGAQ